MILDTTSKTIEIVLASAKTTNDCEYTVDYVDTASGATFAPGGGMGTTNGATAVTAVSAPVASVQRHVKAITIYNADTVDSTVTVRMYDGTNRRIVIKQLLSAGQSLIYTPEAGWSIPSFTGIAHVSGNWTPVDVSGAALTLTVSAASYVLLGELVFCRMNITFPSTANTATAKIGGFPYPVKNTLDNYAAFNFFSTSAAFPNGRVAYIHVSDPAIRFYDEISNSGVTNANMSTINTNIAFNYQRQV